MDKLNIAVVGHRFMGRAHTFAYANIPIIFDPGVELVRHTLCARSEDVGPISKRWGYLNWTHDWHDVINNPEIDIVDISGPSAIHKDVAIAAIQAGKHVVCEKPLALKLSDAQQMADVAAASPVTNMIGFTYRRVPALALAKRFIDEGRLGTLYHFKGIYSQDYLIDPDYPLVWRLQKQDAGYGSHGDLGAHVADMARFLVGDFDSVMCMQKTFIDKRRKVLFSDGLSAVAGDELGDVDVDDSSMMLVRFKNKDTQGYIEASRYNAGYKNRNYIEINGSLGSIRFDMERMGELDYYDARDPEEAQGFKSIQIGAGVHPYMANWWPIGHTIGFGEAMTNQLYDFIMAVKDKKSIAPDFNDGLKCQQFLEAAVQSSLEERWVKV